MDVGATVEYLDEMSNVCQNIIRKNYLNVFFTNTVSDTVFSHLYQKVKLHKYNYFYCTTVGYAVQLLNIDMNEGEMTEILQKPELLYEG